MICPVCEGNGDSLGAFEGAHWYVCRQCAYLFDAQTDSQSFEVFYQEGADLENPKQNHDSVEGI